MGTASTLLGEYEACALRDALTEWLGYTLPTVRHAPAVSGDPRDAALGTPPLSTEYIIDQLKQLRELVPASTGDDVDHTATDGTTW